MEGVDRFRIAHFTFSAYAYLGTRLLVPRIGETNVTIIGFLGSSAGLAIFAIGAVSGNQVLASTCAGLVSMTGMVCPFLFSQHMFLSILNSNTPLTLPQVFPSVRAIISRSADINLQGAVQAAMGLMSAFAAALGECFRLIYVQCFWSIR